MNNLKILSDDDCLFIIVKHKNIPWDIRKIEDISGNPHPIDNCLCKLSQKNFIRQTIMSSPE